MLFKVNAIIALMKFLKIYFHIFQIKFQKKIKTIRKTTWNFE